MRDLPRPWVTGTHAPEFLLVDVFSERPFSGNSLPVVTGAWHLGGSELLALTQELRQFETIFLDSSADDGIVKARVFDLFGELPFAGHPLLGAAAALQYRSDALSSRTWEFDLSGRIVAVEVTPRPGHMIAVLNQGPAALLATSERRAELAQAFGLEATELAGHLPLQVVSTGLSYLVVPVTAHGLARAKIAFELSPLLSLLGADFAVLLDPEAKEIRHWNNDGILEDVATGSAAGVVGAYLVAHGLAAPGERITLSQGRFVGRPSSLTVWQERGVGGSADQIKLSGPVTVVGKGRLLHPSMALR